MKRNVAQRDRELKGGGELDMSQGQSSAFFLSPPFAQDGGTIAARLNYCRTHPLQHAGPFGLLSLPRRSFCKKKLIKRD